MPSIRIGLSTQFNLESEQVGIGTTNPTEFLDILGDIRAEGVAGGGGISTFREYQGFQQTQQGIANNIVIDNGTSGPFSSFAGEILITDETTISSGSTVEVGKTKTLTVTDRFAVPLGETNNRDNAPEPGTTRFNQDFGTLEFFDGVNWKTVNSYARYGAAGRAVSFGGLVNPSTTVVKTIGYWNIHTLGNAQNFGEATLNTRMNAACSNGSRGLFAGAFPANQETIEYVTIPSEGNSIDFGNLSGDRNDAQMGSASSSTRAIWAGGAQEVDIIDYVEISTVGNALDFGDLTQGRRNLGGFGSPTRGVFTSGGENPAFKNNNDYITIASKGNAILWNETLRSGHRGASNQVRGVYAGGYNPADTYSAIDYVTIASLGNAINFGDLSVARSEQSAASTQTRVVFSGGFTTFPAAADSVTNSMEYIEIASTGNAIDFGDYLTKISQAGATSDSHGGLGGF